MKALAQRVERLEGWFVLLSGWPRNLVALLAGAISAMAMAPFDLFFLLFLTIPILIWLIDGASSEPATAFSSKLYEGFKPGFFFGFGYFLAGIWWVANALLVDADIFAWAAPLAIILIPAALGIFWGCATSIARLFWFGEFRRIFMLSACLMLFEYLRGFVATGFPWNTISYAALVNPITMQSASVLGIYGLTAFVVLIAALPVNLLNVSASLPLKRYTMGLLWILLVTLHIGYGVWRLDHKETEFAEGVSLRLVQPAIVQADKFDPTREAEIFKRYLDLSTSENDGKMLSEVTHLIWPESVFPFLLTERRDALSAIAAMLPDGTSLITGAARAELAGASGGENLIFNSVYVIDHEGIIVSAADKVHLVPFGEYLPFQEFLEQYGFQQLTKVQGGFEPGASRKLLSTGVGPMFLPLICYEIIFSGDIWHGGNRPGWILNLTNDAWYGYTPGPFQHERQAIIRGVEEGLPVVRAANTGISGVYTPYGEAVARLSLDEQGIIDSQLPNGLKTTLHSVYGVYIFWSVLALFFVIGVIPSRKT
ncbi:MAG: apolipoprotein N-acyltransferase [Rhizobiaceae bacterium]